MFRSRSWFGGGWGRPKNLHSLEHLKYLYNVMARNQTVSEHNRGLLVESLRSIAEILIWGDQNDSSVFDFFLEKNMLSFFLRIMKQRSGGSSFVCVQLLQTLNILFENIRNETSLYYLLSNNHVNSIIVHKFDFSDEEVMAYYISFLKTLSLKLNAHTIHFFYNEHTNDFPLYTEAIKFFNHSESMVRIAVRTLTLNVYRVDDASMLGFIRDRTAAPYFSNLVWFIGKHVLELDNCVRNDADHQSQNRLSDLVAEHLDHLHYLNDILCLNITDLNHVLTEHLLHKLLIPLYIYSLISHSNLGNIQSTAFNDLSNTIEESAQETLQRSPFHHRNSPDITADHLGPSPRVSCIVSLFLLSQVFLIITHAPLVHSLAWIILNADTTVFKYGAAKILESYVRRTSSATSPETAVPKQLEVVVPPEDVPKDGDCDQSTCENQPDSPLVASSDSSGVSVGKGEVVDDAEQVVNQNITDEEKERLAITPEAVPSASLGVVVAAATAASAAVVDTDAAEVSLKQRIVNKPFLETVLNALDVSENDYSSLFALCLLYALANNRGISPELLAPVFGTRGGTFLAEWLLRIVTAACQSASRVRLVTLALSLRILNRVATSMTATQKTALSTAREQSTALLRNFYKSEEIFLDMFEHEYFDMSKGPLNVEFLCMDAAILLPPTGTPMTGIEFTKRLPCGEVERARRAIRVFFLVRDLSMTLTEEPESQLPLTNPQQCVQVNNVLDLNNSDLIGCTVVMKDGTKLRRFLVIDVIQLILVEPDSKKLGWGVAKLVGFLQDIEVLGDKDDSSCLHITIQRPLSSNTTNRVALLSAKFIFDDHIRCMAAKQRLTKGRIKARQKKMQQIARLLDIPGPTGGAGSGAGGSPMTTGLLGGQATLAAGLNALGRAWGRGREASHRTLAMRPGFAAPRRESLPGSVHRMSAAHAGTACVSAANAAASASCSGGVDETSMRNGCVRTRDSHSPSPGRGGCKTGQVVRSRDSSSSRTRSREGSPRMPRPRSEEIPLELIKKSGGGSGADVAAPNGGIAVVLSRPHTPRLNLDVVLAATATIAEGTESQNLNASDASEETSFIAEADAASRAGAGGVRRKGAIETV